MSAATASAGAPVPTDAELLYSVLGIELLVAFVYQGAVQSGRLSARAERLANELLGHERAHAGVLSLELGRLGSAQPAAPASASAADKRLAEHHVAGSLAKLGSEHDGIRLLLDVEAVAEGAYYEAMSKLSDPRLLRTAARIMASEAQHATLLSQVLHPGDFSKAIPDAFVEGKH